MTVDLGILFSYPYCKISQCSSYTGCPVVIHI